MSGNKLLMNFIAGIPKAELHLHIEGTLEPELMFKIAKRNQIQIKYHTVSELKAAYNFNNLQEFLNIYYNGADVLRTEKDFYDMTWAYFEKIHTENVIHTEIFFDPQTHTNRGIEFKTVINGIHAAIQDANDKYGISSRLIMCFLRDLEVESAFQVLDEALKYKQWITAVGLDSAEVGNPPSKFKKVFERAKTLGFLTVAHAGEEGPAEYVWEAVNELEVLRIDHGNNSLDDDSLVEKLCKLKIPLTVCPLSNLKLQVVKNLAHHPLKKMIDKGLMVTVNSDDPAYFGGYINANYIAVAEALNLTKEEIYMIARNSFAASFLNAEEKNIMLKKVDDYYKKSIQE
jgi:adenine deaminase